MTFEKIVKGLCILGMVTSACGIIHCKIEIIRIELGHRRYLKSCIDDMDTMKELDWMDQHLTECGY